MDTFSLLSALVGGFLIGLSATVLYAGLGRYAGISGILGGLLSGEDIAIRGLFVIGLMTGAATVFYGAGLPPAIVVQSPIWLLVIAGFLVGFGTRLGSGCTSGHGVCGIARLSKRSLVATACFFSTALIVVFLMRHVLEG